MCAIELFEFCISSSSNKSFVRFSIGDMDDFCVGELLGYIKEILSSVCEFFEACIGGGERDGVDDAGKDVVKSSGI